MNKSLNLLARAPRFHFTYETLSQPTSLLTFTVLIFSLVPLGEQVRGCAGLGRPRGRTHNKALCNSRFSKQVWKFFWMSTKHLYQQNTGSAGTIFVIF